MHDILFDIVVAFQPSFGKQYCVTIIDRITAWPKAVPTNVIAGKKIVSNISIINEEILHDQKEDQKRIVSLY